MTEHEMKTGAHGVGPQPQGMNPLPGVRNVVPVGSGKGGVGKSTVSANLAVALAQTGARVGLLDADIYGPSIPTILGITESPQPGTTGILPVDAYGVKVISSGFFLRPDQAVVWRGPMLAKMVEQFLTGVEWGELDYLIVDLPPGTGDVQLTLCQRIPLTGAVVVSTPQDVALRVAEKAIAMFRQLRCPILGLIENMSYYVCPHCGERDNIFDTGGGERAAERWQAPLLGKIPLATGIRKASDDGRPVVLEDPKSPSAAAFLEIARNLVAQISIRNLQVEEPVVRITS
jgi:ATP-binding protein involved in chromosome partitioning